MVGGSDDVYKPGGRILENLLAQGYTGEVCVVNPKNDQVQGVKSYRTVEDLPHVELAVIAIAAKYSLHAVKVLAEQKGTKAFIILSAGYGEESPEGAKLERQIVEVVESVGGSLIGPNCVGVMNSHYTGAFIHPLVPYDDQGIDFITGSGATAVFILELGIQQGLRFASVFSVGNSAQIGVEEVLEYMDQSYQEGVSSKVKMLYLEKIANPEKLLRHARSLVNKGCRIVAVKAGRSAAGSRAASSHTGALATSDAAVDALFRKAGIVRARGRQELLTLASIFLNRPLQGKRMAIITHAGGPAVMLTDALSEAGLEVPEIKGPEADELLAKLFPGSSVANPIDILATGTAEQLATILDTCEKEFPVDAMAVIFGSPGLFPVNEAYRVIHEKIRTCKKPIYPILPSVMNAVDAIKEFVASGNLYFPEEVVLGEALGIAYKAYQNSSLTAANAAKSDDLPIDRAAIRRVIESVEGDQYLSPAAVQQLLDAAGIPRAGEGVAKTADEAIAIAQKLGYPVVMKVVGPVHKSDVGGVAVGIRTPEAVREQFERMIRIKDTVAILLQPMLSGTELYVGAKRDEQYGHLVLCGLGGIFIEVLQDVQTLLAPVTHSEALEAIANLRGVKILDGVRGQAPIGRERLAAIVMRVSRLVEAAPEIFEMDLNPLFGTGDGIIAVDARIRVTR